MSAPARTFDRLHPALQHHVVNTLGWKALRPLQEASIEPILAGQHAVLLAPTASGKTEAAVLPVLSRMLSEDWRGLSVIYVCPLRALLNNLEPRLESYTGLLGRSTRLWHGDVGSAARRRIVAFPPDLLLTTPESIEVMLTSTRTNHRALFKGLQCVIVDELHAFAGDDRGWHLLSVLERLVRLAGRDLQRLGLSATIGNPEELLGWLVGSSTGARCVLAPSAGESGLVPQDEDVSLDYVGNLKNASTVISRLHRGEKRLVFCDSRSRVEELASYLRSAGVRTFVSHSSISLDERRQAERAFSEGRDAVIVATSTLELGIDVGDLDRVIQIDAPATVASFLQRLGRTGRRPGAARNCLFLATGEDAFLRAAGLLQLWREGFVEPVEPPPLPFHILAQQLMALALQEGAVGRETWRDWIGGMPAFAATGEDEIQAILEHMIREEILFEETGLLSMGREGERSYGQRHFMELMSVFLSDPLFAVLHGRNELGHVHPLSFTVRSEEPPVLLLAGRSWIVSHVDWPNRIAYVEPSDLKGRSAWLGSGQALRFELCRAVRRVLARGQLAAPLTERGKKALEAACDQASWVDDESTAIVRHVDGQLRWWTFAGLRANTALAALLGPLHREGTRGENLSIRLWEHVTFGEIERHCTTIDPETAQGRTPITEDALEGLKFSACLPQSVALRTLRERLADPRGVKYSLGETLRFVSAG